MLDFSKNYFELFGLPPDYLIDMGKLATRYRDLQRVLHPDRYVNATERERRLSMQGATRINEAFSTLKNPLARAIYLLSLNGIEVEGENKTSTDPEFLMEQLELREELARIRELQDPQAGLSDLLSRIGQRINALIAQVAVQLEGRSSEQLQSASETVCKMQFFEKLRSEAEAAEAELDESL